MRCPFYLVPAIINIFDKVGNLKHNWIYPLMGKVHRNFHTRMHNLQVYELLQKELGRTINKVILEAYSVFITSTGMDLWLGK